MYRPGTETFDIVSPVTRKKLSVLKTIRYRWTSRITQKISLKKNSTLRTNYTDGYISS